MTSKAVSRGAHSLKRSKSGRTHGHAIVVADGSLFTQLGDVQAELKYLAERFARLITPVD